MAMIVQVVERLAPGGLETLALDLTKRLGSDSRIFSLQGRGNELAEAWPALNSLDQPVECFDRKPGVNIALIGVLRRRLIELKPAAVIVHHIGPLLYAGIAARLAGVRSLIHVEHDAWHYRSQKSHRAILRFAVHILRPQRVAVSAEVAATAAAAAFKSREIEGLPPEAREALARAGAEIEKASKEAARQIEDATETAKENVALFKKYETELKKYAMPGLSLLFAEKSAGSPGATPPPPRD